MHTMKIIPTPLNLYRLGGHVLPGACLYFLHTAFFGILSPDSATLFLVYVLALGPIAYWYYTLYSRESFLIRAFWAL